MKSQKQLFYNGRIYTVSQSQPWADSMLVDNGIILAIGKYQDVSLYAAECVDRVDLNGRFVMPGLHDAHSHLIWAAGRQLNHNCQLQDPRTLDELKQQLLAYWDRYSERGWLVASVYNPLILTPDILTREWLDSILPGVPICLHDYSYHNAMTNTAALEAAGIDRDTVPSVGGVIVKDPLTGEPTGLLRESAWARVHMAVPPRSRDENSSALKLAAAICNQYGITSVQEASAQRGFLEAAHALDSAGDLSLNLVCHIPWGSEFLAGCGKEGQEQLIKERKRYQSPRVFVDAIKIALDGTSMAPTFSHVSLDPVTDQPITYNLLLDSDELVSKIEEWTAEGMMIKAHCTGYGSVRIGLDNYARAADNSRAAGQMHDIAHAHYVSPADRARFAELNVVAEMSPAVWHIPQYQDALGKAYDFKTMNENGALVTVGTDWLLPPTPELFPALAGMLDHGDESVSLPVAIEMMTLNGAIAVGQQSRWGTLAPGKDATFIVLDRNLFDIPPSEIAGVNVVQTYLQGDSVFSRETASHV